MSLSLPPGDSPFQRLNLPRLDAGLEPSSQVIEACLRLADVWPEGVTVAIGMRGREISRLSFGGNGPKTQFPIASASKMLTAATVMAVVDRGLLSLDGPISRWLPALGAGTERLTLRQLLAQTSGLAGSQGAL